MQKKLVDRLNRLKNAPAIQRDYEHKYALFNQLSEQEKKWHFAEIVRYKKLLNIPLIEEEFTYLINAITFIFDKQNISTQKVTERITDRSSGNNL